MARIDGYLRSIERLGANGALFVSGQPVVLKFAAGDKPAQQVTAHDALIAMVREIASLEALAAIDSNRPAQFEFVSNGFGYTVQVSPRPGAWSVLLEVMSAGRAGTAGSAGTAHPSGVLNRAVTPAPGGAPSAPAAIAPATPVVVPEVAPVAADTDDGMDIERTPYDEVPVSVSSGSSMLDELFTAARALRASDLYLSAGMPPLVRVAGELVPMADRPPFTAELLEQELGGVSGPGSSQVFVHAARDVRLRIMTGRDRNGSYLIARLMVAEPPQLERLGLPSVVPALLDQRGVFVVAGPPGSGKTTTIAALLQYVATHANRYIVELSQPVEIAQHARRGLFAQREIGETPPTYAAGLAAAVNEGADVIAVGQCQDPATAAAVIDAAQAGGLVVVGVTAADAWTGIARIADLAHGARAGARDRLALHFAGALGQSLYRRSDGNGRIAAFEVVVGNDLVRQAVATDDYASFLAAQENGAAEGMVSWLRAREEAVRRGAKG